MIVFLMFMIIKLIIIKLIFKPSFDNTMYYYILWFSWKGKRRKITFEK